MPLSQTLAVMKDFHENVSYDEIFSTGFYTWFMIKMNCVRHWSLKMMDFTIPYRM